MIAQVYYHKLYLSELQRDIPSGLSPEDSISIANEYINSWIKEQLILHEAEKNLSIKEKNFDKQLDNYRNTLLVNKYYEKLTSDTAVFKVSQKEMNAFMRSFDKRYTVDREIVQVNYVKLSKHSKLIEPVKTILFDEHKRVSEKTQLVKMLADSVEYFADDNTWLYLDDIEQELPITIQDGSTLLSEHKHIEKEDENYHYLIVFLDYKDKRSVNESNSEVSAARMMLLQQRKQQYLDRYVNNLYDKAIKEGVIIR